MDMNGSGKMDESWMDKNRSWRQSDDESSTRRNMEREVEENV